MTSTPDQVQAERRNQRLIVFSMMLGFFLLSFMQRNERGVLLKPVLPAASAFAAVGPVERLDPVLANGFYGTPGGATPRFFRTARLDTLGSSPILRPAFEGVLPDAGLFVGDADGPLAYDYDYASPGLTAADGPNGVPGARDQAPEAGISAAVGAVPEPSSWLLMIVGIGGIGCVLRYQRRRQIGATLAPATA